MIRLNAIIMAAGQSRRFGSNKLLLPLQGKPIIQHLLDQFPFQLFHQVVLVYSHEQVRTIAKNYPLILCHNEHPSLGKWQTIQLGLKTCDDAEGTLFLVADQPLLKEVTIITLAETFRQHPTELKSLQGDIGGRTVIRQHSDLLMPIPFNDPNEFIDIDTPETYNKLTELCLDKEYQGDKDNG